ncbi:MAG: hypothetical protein KGP12_01665 [Actinomycetales bacterium]|nr:hypothetical protein [Actinomycetales bacterium]
MLRVISGNPTPEEIAAILALVAAGSAHAAGVTASRGRDDGPGSLWADRERMLSRLPAYLPAAGPGAWRASMMPR